MSASKRNNVLVALAYVTLLAILGGVAYRLFAPTRRPEATTGNLPFQAGEQKVGFAVGDLPPNQAAPDDPLQDRPWAPPPVMPREEAHATPPEPMFHADGWTPPPTPRWDSTAPAPGRSCRRCPQSTSKATDPNVTPAPTPEPIHESVGTRKTTLPISSQP